MKEIRIFKNPRGDKLRGFLFFCVTSILTSTASSHAAVTNAEREKQINRSGFQEGSMKKYAIPQPADEVKVQKVLSEAREAIYMNPDEWIRAVLKIKNVNADLRRSVFNVLESLDVWVCKEQRCAPCSSEGSGCATSRPAAGGMAVTALIHPCLILDKKCEVEPRTLNAWAERVLGQTVYLKMIEDRNATQASRNAKAASDVIKKTTNEVNALLGSCPGPFNESGYRFLRSSSHLENPVPAFEKCGRQLLSSLQKIPTSCRELSESSVWKKFQKEWMTGPDISIERCDDTCRILLCQAKDTILYLSKFGEKKRLLIPGRACEGERLNQLGENIIYALPESLRANPLTAACIKKLDPLFETK